MFAICTIIEQTLLKQIVTGDEILALVHLFLLKKLLCMCIIVEVTYWYLRNGLVTYLGAVH